MFNISDSSSTLNNTFGGTNSITSTIKTSSLLSILNELHGIKCDPTSGELFKLYLPANNLNGNITSII